MGGSWEARPGGGIGCATAGSGVTSLAGSARPGSSVGTYVGVGADVVWPLYLLPVASRALHYAVGSDFCGGVSKVLTMNWAACVT
jgi:hypothetical protein